MELREEVPFEQSLGKSHLRRASFQVGDTRAEGGYQDAEYAG